MTKVPILTCFVPSLAPGAPFRVSIHSWVKPTGSAILKSYMTLDETIAFEARIYLDGLHHGYVSKTEPCPQAESFSSSRILNKDTIWPEVVGESFFMIRKAKLY